MMNAQLLEREIAIAGAGIAAAAVAIQLSNYGFRPVLLSRGLPCISGIEAISESALRLFAALDLLPVLERAGGVWVEGFENAWQSNETIVRSGSYIHVERMALWQAMLAAAIERGATLITCHTRPAMRVAADCVRVKIDRVERQFAAAIDATGRSAIWSRSVRWHHRDIATIYQAIGNTNLLRGRIARISDGWVYRLGLPDRITVGVVSAPQIHPQQLDATIREHLCLEKTQLSFIGRRPAFPQWAAAPIEDRRIAVGDAALASNPIAGQGIRFALSSALAAAAVVRTWHESPADRDGVTEFYNKFAIAERQQHLVATDSLYASESVATNNIRPQLIFDRTNLPLTICFTAKIAMTKLYINGLIQPAQSLVLPDGKAVRWLGNFDLLTLQEFGREPIPTATVIDRLTLTSISQEYALLLIQWCLEHEVFSSIPSSTFEKSPASVQKVAATYNEQHLEPP
jgi:flavin-dependent dehydrogenase